MPADIVFHPRFVEHRQGEPGHPERPERLEAIVARLRGEDLWENVREPQGAPWEALARAHDEKYLMRLKNFGEGSWDFDTYVRPETCGIAGLAAGGAMLAAELAWHQKRPALALVRPPGHHATRETAMGFCYFNNVAVAALAHLSAGRGRVAIVDLDVHHGNGTQEILYRRGDALFISLHQWPLYPGTGSAQEVGKGPGEGFNVNIPLPAGSGDATYRVAFERIVEPILEQYAPTILLVSLGVDAHMVDPLANMTLSSPGYVELIERLWAVARRTCGGRMAIMLEGGYHAEALAEVVAGVAAMLAGERLRLPLVFTEEVDREVQGREAIGKVCAQVGKYWGLA